MVQIYVRPFAESGDKTNPPDNDNAGFVSFTQGYTADYEINLAANNPQAKAVERQVQNALFNGITDNLLWYQSHGFMQYSNTITYQLNDMVVDNTGSTGSPVWEIFRSRINNNGNKPSTVSQNTPSPTWEKIPLPSAIKSMIPFPAGGDLMNVGTPVASLLLSGANLNNLARGFFVAPNPASVSGIVNRPNAVIASNAPFTLEQCDWTTNDGSVANYKLQRVVTIDGNIFIRSSRNNAWSNWTQQATANDTQGGIFNFAQGSSSTPAQSVSLTPLLGIATLRDGMIIRFVALADNTGPFSVTIANSTTEVLGRDLLSLPAGAIIANQIVEIIYRNGRWHLLSSMGGQFVVPLAIADNAAPTWKQVKDLFATALNFDKIFPVGFIIGMANGTNPNAAFPPTVWTRIPDGVVLRTVAAGQSAANVYGNDNVTLTMQNMPLHSHGVNIATNEQPSYQVQTQDTDLGQRSTSESGWHGHGFSGTTNPGGYHGHSAYADTQGAHAHAFVGDDQLTAYYGVAQYRVSNYDARSDSGGMANLYWTSTAGQHSHNIGVNAGGEHQHTYGGNTEGSGNHTHTLTIGAHRHTLTIPAHSHQVVGDTASAGQSNPSSISVVQRHFAMVGWFRSS